MVKFLSVSGVNTETHPEINTHILNFPSQKDTPPHTHAYTHVQAGSQTCQQSEPHAVTRRHTLTYTRLAQLLSHHLVM